MDKCISQLSMLQLYSAVFGVKRNCIIAFIGSYTESKVRLKTGVIFCCCCTSMIFDLFKKFLFFYCGKSPAPSTTVQFITLTSYLLHSPL